MLLIIHLLVGAVIGKYVNNLGLIILLALASHYILDIIPHYKMTPLPRYLKEGFNGTTFKGLLVRAVEPVFGLILFGIVVYLNKEKAVPMLTAGFFAFFPDLINFIGWKYSSLSGIRKLVPYPGNLFYHEAKSKIIGIGTHIILGIAALVAIFIKLKPNT